MIFIKYETRAVMREPKLNIQLSENANEAYKYYANNQTIKPSSSSSSSSSSKPVRVVAGYQSPWI
jgi:hypothetical protein